jgi:hypothetical protein
VPAEGLADIARGWPRLLELLKGSGPGVRVRALLREASPMSLDADQLTIGFPYAIFSEKAQEPLNRQELEKALSQVYGRAFRLAFQTVTAEQLHSALPPLMAAEAEGSAPVSNGAEPLPTTPGGPTQPAAGEEGVVAAAQKILGARITDVRPRQPRQADS